MLLVQRKWLENFVACSVSFLGWCSHSSSILTKIMGVDLDPSLNPNTNTYSSSAFCLLPIIFTFFTSTAVIQLSTFVLPVPPWQQCSWSPCLQSCFVLKSIFTCCQRDLHRPQIWWCHSFTILVRIINAGCCNKQHQYLRISKQSGCISWSC